MIGEAAGAAGESVAPLAAADPTSPEELVLDVQLSGGAQFRGEGQPDGCQVAGPNVQCTFEQPEPGETVTFVLGVTTEPTPGRTASATIERDGEVEDSASVTLD